MQKEMQIFTTKIVDMCKEAKLFASQGGPIILAQVLSFLVVTVNVAIGINFELF